MKGTSKKLWRVVLGVAAVYILCGSLLYFIQDLLLFHPTKLAREHAFAFDQPHREWNVAVGQENLNVIKFLTAEPRKGIVLYFHGNMQNVERYASFARLFTANGYETWMMDYPGFGKTTGKLTEQRIGSDAALLYRSALSEVKPANIIIYGKSLGTGVAAQLASAHPCQQLILETPYYSIPAVAKSRFPIYPVNLLIRYSFPTYSYLPLLKVPVTMLHGTNDGVIPFGQARRLLKENPKATLVAFEGGEHNNLASFPRFTRVLDSLLGKAAAWSAQTLGPKE
jgi:alpha-beta hydrolase superfamily lysophospholipase